MRLLLAVYAVALAACAPIPYPQPPPPLPAFDIVVRVFSPDQVPVADAIVQVTSGPDAGREVRTSTEGFARLQSLSIGPVTICAAARGYKGQCLDVSHDSWGERVTFVLER